MATLCSCRQASQSGSQTQVQAPANAALQIAPGVETALTAEQARIVHAVASISYHAAVSAEDINPLPPPESSRIAAALTPLPLAEALKILSRDTSFGAQRRRFEAKKRLTASGPHVENVEFDPDVSIAAWPNSLAGPECCSAVACTFEFVDDGSVAYAAIDYTISFADPKATTANLAPSLDPRNWDQVAGSWFGSTKYVGSSCPSTCAQTDPDLIPELDSSMWPIGTSWKGPILEHYASICHPNTATCSAFTNYLYIQAERQSDPAKQQAYNVNYRLCDPPCGSLASIVLAGPNNASPSGITTDCGYTTAVDESDGLAKITGIKRLGFCGDGNTAYLGMMARTSLAALVEATATALCAEIGAGAMTSCGQPTQCLLPQVGTHIDQPPSCDDEQVSECS